MYDYISSLFSFWDILLLVVVTTLGTAVAYMHRPILKALAITLPLPFTVASMAVGKPLGIQNLGGLLLLAVYTYGVYFLYRKLRVPIIISIIVSAAVYCLLGSLLASRLPQDAAAFWYGLAVTVCVALLLALFSPPRLEEGQRAIMNPVLKVIIILTVVTTVIMLKKYMQGFITVFPMVGVIASFESRKCLWTLCSQIPIIILSIGSLVATCYIFQPVIGLGWGIAVGWASFVTVLVALQYLHRLRLKKRLALQENLQSC